MIRIAFLLMLMIAATCGPCLAQKSLPTLVVRQHLGSTMVWLGPKDGHVIPESLLFEEPGTNDVLGAFDEMSLLKERVESNGMDRLMSKK